MIQGGIVQLDASEVSETLPTIARWISSFESDILTAGMKVCSFSRPLQRHFNKTEIKKAWLQN